MTARKLCLGVLAVGTAWLLGLGTVGAGLTDGLVVYWSFDEDFTATFGDSAYDGTPSSNTGGATAAITTTAGEYKFGGGGAKFSRADQQYVKINASPVTRTEYTYSAWLYLNVDNITVGDRYQVLDTGPDYVAAFSLRDWGGASGQPSGDIGEAYMRMAGGAGPKLDFALTNHETWHNVIVTASYDEASNSTRLTGYLNGVLQSSTSSAGKLRTTDSYMHIGACRVPNIEHRAWEGYLDDMAVWDRVLTAPEIAYLQTVPLSAPRPPILSGLVAHWSFDEDFDATLGGPAYNLTPNNNPVIDSDNSRFGGGSLRLDRNQEQALEGFSPFTNGSYSYAAWYYFDRDAISGSDRHTVLSATNDVNGIYPAVYELRNRGGQVGEVGEVWAHPTNDSNFFFNFDPGDHEQWRHIAVTYDETTGVVNAYLDGFLAGTKTMTAANRDTSIFRIGAGRAGMTGSDSRLWDGWIDDVTVWNRVLTHEEILYLQFNPVPEPGTALLAVGLLALLCYPWRRRK